MPSIRVTLYLYFYIRKKAIQKHGPSCMASSEIVLISLYEYEQSKPTLFIYRHIFQNNKVRIVKFTNYFHNPYYYKLHIVAVQPYIHYMSLYLYTLKTVRKPFKSRNPLLCLLIDTCILQNLGKYKPYLILKYLVYIRIIDISILLCKFLKPVSML